MFSRIKNWFNEREKTANMAKTALNVFMNPGFNAAKATLEHLLFEAPWWFIKSFFIREKKRVTKRDHGKSIICLSS